MFQINLEIVTTPPPSPQKNYLYYNIIFLHNYYFATDVISAEKAGLLCELLDEIGRKDLTAIVKEYMNKLDGKYTIHDLIYHKATCEMNLSK